MKNRRRILVILLSICIVAAMMPVTGFASEEEDSAEPEITEGVEWVDQEAAGLAEVTAAGKLASRQLSYERIAGADRYETSIKVAEKVVGDKGSLDTVVIATGKKYPDALSGGALANNAGAPLILVNEKASVQERIISFIEEYRGESITVYLLGGTDTVDTEFEDRITSLENCDCIRFAGVDRYETNLMVIKEINNRFGINDRKMFIATGNGYADSLSVSGYLSPVMLVQNVLTDEQKQFLAAEGSLSFIVMGSNKSVSDTVYEELQPYKDTIIRYSGEDRYETSVMASEIEENGLENVMYVRGDNFPDGLSAGPLANKLGAPIVLVPLSGTNTYIYEYNMYSEAEGIKHIIIIGGPTSVKDSAARIYNCLVLTDISEQRLMCFVNGNLKLDADVITGTKGKYDTPIGTYSVYNKARNTHLRGSGWDYDIDAWIGFIGRQYGFHDAWWVDDSLFDTHKQYLRNGSHGCVNMRTKDVLALYDMVKTGTPVIIKN